MRRFKGLIFLFTAALAIPLAYFIFQSYQSFEQEETAQLRYFAETLFDEMEQTMAELVRREEGRLVDAYSSDFIPPSDDSGQSAPLPLSKPPAEDFIIGYFQNNPDGSFQSPLAGGVSFASPKTAKADTQLRRANRILNEKLAAGHRLQEPQPAAAKASPPNPRRTDDSFAERYLKRPESEGEKNYLGRQEKQVQELSEDQAFTLVPKDRSMPSRQSMTAARAGSAANPMMEQEKTVKNHHRGKISMPASPAAAETAKESSSDREINGRKKARRPQAVTIRAEIDPLQSIFVENDLILIYRRIMLDNRILRQGFVIRTADFLKYLAESHFSSQPISRYTQLTIQARQEDHDISRLAVGGLVDASKFTLPRTFPRPFSFLTATLSWSDLPRSPGRNTLNIMIAILAGIFAAGLIAIYRSVQALVDLSERRSKFVSSVTHELKTPLTNIRMYVEMLEQGLARSPEQEQEYLRILGSESGRLARLINNILDFSKIRKKELRLDLQAGAPGAVILEACRIMEDALQKEGFTLEFHPSDVPPVAFDREMLIQVLINLLENSVKFGRKQSQKDITVRLYKDGRWTKIDVSDTGPGIPREDLKRVFDDFYRVENALIRSTSGTGIGLAFVRKVMTAMEGRVSAANNHGPGCTITLWFPGQRR